MAKKKFYVVWSGKQTGIFETWEDCRKQVIGVKGSRYKSFPSREEAEAAFSSGGVQSTNKNTKKSASNSLSDANYIADSISVDAACSGNPGLMEYKGVNTKTEEEIFHYGPVPNGTNNIGEFLAIVHALALLKQKESNLPVYSDSRTAISWVRKQQVNTTIKRDASTEQLWERIDHALHWLNTNSYTNEVLKWETHLWGESKADFGRK